MRFILAGRRGESKLCSCLKCRQIPLLEQMMFSSVHDWSIYVRCLNCWPVAKAAPSPGVTCDKDTLESCHVKWEGREFSFFSRFDASLRHMGCCNPSRRERKSHLLPALVAALMASIISRLRLKRQPAFSCCSREQVACSFPSVSTL